ncbi:hypothetical protein [Brachybacterium sp. GPGPB12]|uniref:hypothetical protein n=1 Tax=Brachybacterium sp. GPGPB12 TaxID=3023517 RepID=UPI003134279A
MLASTVLAAVTDVPWIVAFPLWLVVPMTIALVLPPGRMALAALLARSLLRGVTPGAHPRGGRVHLALWIAEHVQDELGATSLSGAVWFPWYARALGVRLGKGADLHALPPVTGMLEIGDGASIEPEVDLAGYWIDGDVAAHRPRPDREAGPHRRPQAPSAPAPESGRTPRSRPARPCSGRCRPASSGPAPPPPVAPRPAAPGPTRHRRAGRSGRSSTGRCRC